jgi:histidinol-phosphate/aromatic aminotransferase/cobyric acid decarboxylase-like protein
MGNSELISNIKQTRPMYECDAFAVLFGCEIIDNLDEQIAPFLKDIEEGKKYLSDAMKERGFVPIESYNNALLIKVGKKYQNLIYNHLKKNDIYISKLNHFTHPVLKECIRISLGPKYLMKLVINKIDDIL